jgi:hypothetical protein
MVKRNDQRDAGEGNNTLTFRFGQAYNVIKLIHGEGDLEIHIGCFFVAGQQVKATYVFFHLD